MTDPRAARDELNTRLQQHPADRYPVQHATARFHLGALLLSEGKPTKALEELGAAAELFQGRLPVEYAKTLNLVGAAARELGDADAARTAFEQAIELLEDEEQQVEAAAARYNLGLALLDRESPEEAAPYFEQARDAFEAAGALQQAAAAAREAGAAQLTAGHIDGAVETLTAAREQAGKAGDAAGAGTAANTLGLACLAAERLSEAVDAFEAAVADNPRSLRPESHAMANANLALARERAGQPAHARLAARQALSLRAVPASVRDQAQQILDRLGQPAGDALEVLDEEMEEGRWSTILRAEVARQVDASPEVQRQEAAAWVTGVLARRSKMQLIEAWLGALLELPTEMLKANADAVVAAAAEQDGDDAQAFLDAVRRGAARFHLPQMERLEQIFGDAAERHGVQDRWQ